jgi:ketol-acid reductoisomerase
MGEQTISLWNVTNRFYLCFDKMVGKGIEPHLKLKNKFIP